MMVGIMIIGPGMAGGGVQDIPEVVVGDDLLVNILCTHFTRSPSVLCFS